MKSIARLSICALSMVPGVPDYSALTGITLKARDAMAILASTLRRAAQRLRSAGILLVVLGMTLGSMAQAQTANEWTWMGGSSSGFAPGVYGTEGMFAPGNIPGSRQQVPTWTDASGNVWIFGGDNYNDVWKFNSATNEWAWMAGDTSGGNPQPGVYGTIGVAGSANVPGTRYGALAWADKSGNFWLFGGYGRDANGTQGELNDLWEFSPTTLLWTWMGGSSTIPGSGGVAGVYGTLGTPAAGNYPGSRNTSAIWTDNNGNFWLFAGYGYDSNDNNLTLSDLWEFNPSTLQWTWMGGSKTGNAAPIYGTLGTPAPGNIPGGRGSDPMAWVDKAGNFWLFGGGGIGANYQYGELNDLWQFNPSTGQWTWMGGSSNVGSYCAILNGYNACGQSGVYGTLGTPSAANIPGARLYGSSWIDTSGNLWLFGGRGFDANGDGGDLNDLWEFNTFTSEWTWVGGSDTTTAGSLPVGVYGSLGVQAAGNTPGGRDSTSSWTDKSGNLWLFAGFGVNGTGNLSELNEVWQYQPPSSSLPAAATPSFNLAPGNYTTVQTVTISDSTPDATIYYTTNGTAPTINSSVYSGAITVSSPESIEAIAVAGGYSNSGLAAAFYNVVLPIAATPTLSLASGSYTGAQTVTISDVTPGATIYYTTDGTMPNTGSTAYGGSIIVSSTETLNAIAVAYEYANSTVATATYTITPLAATSPGEWTWVAGGTTWSTGVWGTLGVPAPANIPGDRSSAATWTDSSGHFWLFGGGGNDANWNGGDLNDLWEYNPATNLWTWVSGSSLLNCGSNGCSQPGVYGTLGIAAAGNVPGGRQQASTWIDSSGNLWLFGGNGTDSNGNSGDLNDLWKFNPSTNLWTWMGGSNTIGSNGGQGGVYGTLGTPAAGNIPGARVVAESWTDKAGHFWLFGGLGYDSTDANVYLNDLWEFDPSTNLWTWKGGNNNGVTQGVYGTLGTPSAGNIPGARVVASSWTDNAGNLWLFGGWGFDVHGSSGFLNDLWEFNPSTNQWTWTGGGNTIGTACAVVNGYNNCGQVGVYGTQGVPAAGNMPGARNGSSAWTDSSGNLWLFGGSGFDWTGAFGDLIELWEFNPFTNQWAWMGGNNTVGSGGGQPGVYGTLGVPAPGNIPGARTGAAAWTGSNGNLWLMGGCGFNPSDVQVCLNDLWEYQPSDTVSSSPAATPSFSLAPGNYTTIQTLTITDATPGATIYYTTNGTAPTINSAVYGGPITISSPESIEAVAVASGYSNSAVATAYYNVVVPVTATPTFSLAAGGYDTPQSVTISDATPGATIYYAINGTPTTSSTVYSGPITISSTETLEAIAAFSGYANSAVASAAYTVNIPAATSPGEWTWVGGNSALQSSVGYAGIYGMQGTPAPGNMPGGRYYPSRWTDSNGHLWVFGGGGDDVNDSYGRLNDLWEFNPSTDQWTWISGSNTALAPGVYGTLGIPAAGNVPGARQNAFSWIDKSGNLWLFGGTGYNASGVEGYLNDLWMFNPSTSQWTWMGGTGSLRQPGVYGTLGVAAAGNIPGARAEGMSWTDNAGNLWLFGGTAYDANGNSGLLNDLWVFNPSTGQWTWMGGSSIAPTNGSGQAAVYGTLGTPAPANIPEGRQIGMTWTDSGGNLWLFGGNTKASGTSVELNDLWEFSPSTNEWTWMGGTSSTNQNGVYGTLGMPAAGNIPGGRDSSAAWTDQGGNLWLYGGDGYAGNPGSGYLADLWEFSPTTNEWTWMGGSSNRGPFGVYGTLGVPAAGNLPGARYADAAWTGSSGNFWLFAGFGKDINGNTSRLNDLWLYQPVASLPAAATPTFSVPAGNYTSIQTVTINDATAGATIYYTTNGTAPTLSSSVYSGAITVSSTETLEAVAIASGYSNSATATAAYTVILPTATPVISLATGVYDTPQTVTISDATAGATIYYTTNGTTPTTASNVYSGPLTLSSETLEAVALAGGYSLSTAAIAYYTDTVPAATAAGEWTWVGGNSNLASPTGFPGVYGTQGTPAPGNIPGARYYPASWTDSSGHFWLFGGGGFDVNDANGRLGDLWEFNPSTNEWTWVGGSQTENSSGVYGTMGVATPGNVPGARQTAASWIDKSGNLWLFGGSGYDSTGHSGYLDDLWEYTPSTNQWTWMGGSSTIPGNGSGGVSGVYGTLGVPAAGNYPGSRQLAMSWVDSNGNFWLFGGPGYDSAGTKGNLNDLWMFNPSTQLWTWMGGSNTVAGGLSGVYGTQGTPAAGNVPGSRQTGMTWTDSGGNLWLFGGQGASSGQLNDLWEFSPSTNQWTWMGGSTSANQSGVYGTQGNPAAGNFPGGRVAGATWTDQGGNLWLFGGDGYDNSGNLGQLNDLWEFSPSTLQWTWIDGGSTMTTSTFGTGLPGVYGTLGIPAAANMPGGHYATAKWTGSNGNFWMFTGTGFDAFDHSNHLNDLWEYQPANSSLQAAATPTFSVPAGNYSSIQTVTISDTTAGATIYYTTNGTAPNINSSVYSGAITVSSTETLEAVALESGYSPSSVATAAYTVILPTATPTISLASGTYDQAQTTTISDATPGATIYYAINGTPTTSSTVYSGPITVSSTETLEAIALASGYSTSATATASYTDNVPAATSFGEWTWVSGSSSIAGASKGASGVLGTLGVPAPGNVPESRDFPATWTDSNGNFWLLGGTGYNASGYQGLVNDFWEFNKATNLWTWMGGSTTPNTGGIYGTQGVAASGNMPGSRSTATVWQDGSGNLWLFGGAGTDSTGAIGYLNDLWKYTPSTNQWTWMSGSSTGGGSNPQPGVFGTLGVAAPGNMPGGRDGASGWTDSNGNLWLYGGSAYDANGVYGYLGDLWEYTPSTNQWTWMGGSNTLSCAGCYSSANYGTQGTPATGNTPGGRRSPATWTDSGGNLWLFGGYVSPTSGTIEFNDLWEFSPSTNQWTWVGGSNAPGGNQNGVYGIEGTPAPGNIPGGRDAGVAWTDAQGNLWLFGGFGYNAVGGKAYLGDLWEYSPFTNEWTWMVGSNTSGTNSNSLNMAGVYGSLGVPGANNVPGSRDADAGWVDQSGNLWLIGGNGEDANKVSGFLNDLWVYQSAQSSMPQVAPPVIDVTVESEGSAQEGLHTPLSFASNSLALPANTVELVTISDTTPNATIYYTTNGALPTAASTVYTGPFTISPTQTVEATATATGYATSRTTNMTASAPSITWATPAPISYGTALSGAQLNATANVAGTFIYSPAAGTVLTGGAQTLSVTFTPADTKDYTTVSATVTLTVNQITSQITWAPPAAITYGTALSATQLDATASVPGNFVYSPAAGTVLGAGVQTLSVTFTPNDTTDYTTVTSTVELTVNQATPTVTWSAPAAITYGTALSATQLDATASVPGTFTYTPAAGTVLGAGSQSLSVSFTPSDTTDYTTATGSTTLTVNKAAPTVSWATPAAITYGAALSGTQLDATASVAGTFVYTPASGTVLGAGSQSLSVSFTPSDTTDYTMATGGTTLTVNKATPTVTWSTPAAITYETALSGTQLDATASTAGTFVYSPAAGTVLPGGSQALSVIFTPGDTTDYTTATGSTTLTVNPAAQTITFAGPSSPVTYGVSPITLSATASSTLAVTFSATGPATVSGNTLTITGAGSVGITASQLGNNDYTAATPVLRTLTVNKATPTASLSSSESSGAYGASVTLTATLTGAGVSPTGTVTFINRGTTLGTATLSGGVATLTTTALPVGFHFVTASYAGDTNYLTATSSPVRIIVNKATQTISFTLASPVTYGVSPITLSATATSGLTVTYSATGPATISGSTLTITGAGTVVVTASQAGDADYSAATNVTQTLVVNKATPAITWATPAAINYGTALSGTQLDASASVGGTFAYSPASGTVLAVGSHTLSVAFTPTDSADYSTATATVTLTVNKATPTITWTTPAAITYGTALSGTQLDASATVGGTFVYSPASGTVLAAGSQTLSVTFTPTNTTDYATATRTVTLTVNKATPTITWATPASIGYGTALGATQLDASSSVAGTFAYSPAAGTVLAAGTHTLSVTLTPTDTTDYNTATATVSLTVTKASQTITFTPPATPVVYGVAPIALSASSTSGLAVTFSIVSGPGTVNGSTLTITGVGTVVVAANQAGNADYTAAAQVTRTVVVNKATPGISLTSSASTVTHGTSVTFTATLAAGGAEPTGTVTFYNGGTTLGTGTLNGSGVATYSTNTLSIGTHSITATYGGNTNYLTVTSTAVSVTVSFP